MKRETRMAGPRGLFAAAVLVGMAVLWGGSASAQEQPTVRFTSRAVEVAVGGRVQTLFSTTSADGAIPAAWEMRRARLELAVRANPVVSARLQPEFSGTQIALRDAYVAFDISPAARLWVGNAFRPFGLIAQTSSTLILPIERGGRIRGVSPGILDHANLIQGLGYADRDVGIQLRGAPAGAPLGLTYGVGVFNGPAQAAAGDELSLQYAARVSIAPVPDVRIGAGWSRRDFATPATAVREAEVSAGNAFEVDFEYGGYAPGFHLVAEATHGVLNPFAGNLQEGANFTGAQLWLGYRTPTRAQALTNLEPIFRISHGNPDIGPGGAAPGAGGTLLTPGINVYFGPLNRIMVNYEAWRPEGGGAAESSFKALFQIAF